MTKMNLLLSLLCILLLASCNSKDNGFQDLEDITETTSPVQNETEEAVDILSVSPTEDPVILISTSTKTFAVQVNSGSGDVNYTFKLDGSLLQNSSSPFYNISSSGVSAGAHSLVVEATNSNSSDSHTFNLRKNTPPTINLNSNTSPTISCVADSFQLNVTANDIDGDNLTYKFYLNGAEGSAYLATSTGLSSATAVFTPNCSLSGNNNVTIRVIDQYGEYNEYSMAVMVTNPNVTSINSYSPTSNPVVILSNETKGFIISATGNPPLSYQWDITNGSVISSCNNLTSCSLSGGDFSPGNYVLKATVTDVLATTDSHSFNITINQKPQISFQTPSNASAIKMNCGSSKNFQLNISDANWATGQSHTISWFFDGASNPALTNTTNLGVHPMTSDATFSPNCQGTLIGDHKVKAIISDGYETQEVEWDVSVNYFSETCNNLGPGEICTIAGLVGMGSGLSTVTQNSEVRIQPQQITNYPSGGFFFTDASKHAVWFYNDTASSVTVFGKTIAAHTVYALFGTINYGTGVDGQSYNAFYLYSPQGIAYSASENALYVSDYNNHRIVRFNSNGEGYHWAGGNTGNTDGATRKSHKCANPVGLTLDDSEGKIFVACYSNTGGSDGAYKYFLTGSDQGHTLLRYGTPAEGSILYAGTGRSHRAYSILKDPNKRIIYAGDLGVGKIMAISYGDTESYHNGVVSLAANSMKLITKGAALGESYNKAWNDSTGRLRPYELAAYVVGGVTRGIFWTQQNRHSIGFLNLTNADITLGGRTVSAGKFHLIWGIDNTADYSRGEPAYNNTLGNRPTGIKVVGNFLYIADTNNNRISKLDISTTNGVSSDLVGNLGVGDYDSESPKQANMRYFNSPRSLIYSSTDNSILINDNLNRRIRKMNLATGNITTQVGIGSYGNSNSNPEDPMNAYFQNIGDMSLSDDGSFLYYTDYQGSNGVNRNCLSRLYNTTNSTQSMFNQSIPANRVYTIAGNYNLGCNIWSYGTYNNTAAVSSVLNYPVGIVAERDNSAVYISDIGADCIFKVDSSGVINEHIGQCGSASDVSGTFANARFTNPGALTIDSDSTLAANGNFFVIDRWTTTTSYIKYVNQSASTVNIMGIDINAGEVGKLITSEGYVGGITSFEDQICYTQGANAPGHSIPHNVICVNRITGLTTLRVGKISASTVKAASAHYNEEEGITASSSTLASPWGVAFDSDGNLYISNTNAHNIRMVKRWF